MPFDMELRGHTAGGARENRALGAGSAIGMVRFGGFCVGQASNVTIHGEQNRARAKAASARPDDYVEVDD